MLFYIRNILILFTGIGLSACMDWTGPNDVVIDDRDDGSFTGSAGENWTRFEITDLITEDVCDGFEPNWLDFSYVESGVVFSGQC